VAADAPPAPRIRYPVKKIRINLRYDKLTGKTQVLKNHEDHEEHKKKFLKKVIDLRALCALRGEYSFSIKGTNFILKER
jgi:hypothetical protein